MPTRPGSVNRGPAAADENRRALLVAARRVMTGRGYQVPMSAIAREAGVGQGVLYRHFPTRLDLAFAVFEDSFTELEALAGDPGPDAFGRLWSRLVQQTIETSAFVEMLVDARGNPTVSYDGEGRLRALLDTTLRRAQHAGLVDDALTVDDVLLAWRMVFGVVVTASDPAELTAAAARAQALLPLP